MQAEYPLPVDLFDSLDKTSPVPLYYQLATALEAAIRAETVPPGSRLENEISLGNRLGLSRPTIRRALQELVDKGLLVRRRGIGTQVVHGRVTRNVELTSLYEDLGHAGQTPTTRVISYEIGIADETAATELGVPVGNPVLELTRLRSADGVPLAILENTLPEDFIGITREELEVRGLYQLLKARGVAIRVANQRIGARAANANEADLLEIRRGSPLLTMSRTAFDNSGRAVEFGRHVYRPDLYSFELTLVDR
ncbi:GntR family transcriptional regulator [Leifsonia sp. EB34]|uniref:GntR family transcriptional regulator n=1 Tax=Leifsonia sp. EB34 TaxID=3156303 RepID=UPI0035137DC4